MNYKRQIEEIVKYIKAGEKPVEEYKIGVEYEHFVIYKDSLKTVSYYGENGVAESLGELTKFGWIGQYEGEYILGLSKNGKYISLEPGSQLEFSIEAVDNLIDIDRKYVEFLDEILPILDYKNQTLIATGYHPETKIDDIKLLPKNRYDFMFNYFKTKGSHAHNMMKGSGSLQISIDYSSEEDYTKKFRVANILSPVLYAIFDNSYYFEGKPWKKHNIRTHIWNNCDNDRSGVVGDVSDDFGYEDYARYILNVAPIFEMKNGEAIYTGNKKVKDIFNPENYKVEELEHLLTMVFPDTRTKDYIEIRMIDAVPYPFNLSAVSLIKGIFYSDENLDNILEYIGDVGIEDIEKSKMDIIENGLLGELKDRSILEIGRYLVELAKGSLDEREVKYILPLERLLNSGENLFTVMKNRDEEGLSKKEILKDSILSNIIEVKQ